MRETRLDPSEERIAVLPVSVTLSAAALITALAGLIPAGVALAVAGLVAAARAAGLLLRRGPDSSWNRPAGAGLAFCGVSTVAAGVALAVAPHAMFPDVPLPAELPLIGLFFVAGTFLAGLFHLAAQPATYLGRVRRLLDGVGIGVLLFFIAWLVVFQAAGLKGAGLTAVLVASVAVGAAVVGTMRAAPMRPGAVLRGVGVLVTIVAQTALILILDYHLSAAWLPLAGVPLVAGPLLAGRVLPPRGTAEAPGTASPDGSFARYPLLALPLAAAIVAAAYHLVVAGRFDALSAALAIVGVLILAVREALAVADVRQYARWLAEREARFRALVAGSADVTMMLDDTLVVRWQSPAAARRLGLADADVVGRPLLDRVHPDEAEAVGAALRGGDTLIEARLGDGFGVWRDTEWSVSDQRADPSVRAVVVHVRDISQRRQLEHALRQVARSDQLTGLANRAELRRLLAERTVPCVLVVLGLDGLSSVNQLRGHEVGDAVLVEAVRRLRAALSPGELAARLSGDQFAVLTAGGAVHAQMTASRLLTLLSDPYPVLGVASHLSASAGLAEHVAGEGPSDRALSRAELALQRARQLGPAQPPQWYDEATTAQLRRRLTIEQDLPGALARGELDLLFQPVVELPSGRVAGVEARPRWRRAGLGAVEDAEFLPVADQLGLHLELGAWLLAAAGRQLAVWGGAAPAGRPLWLAFTVSPAMLAHDGFVDLLAAAGFPPSLLVVQFTVPDPELPDLVDRLTAVRMLGARTALDGFGVQATSLSLLRRLPLDLVRVDRRTFAGADTAVVAAVVNLARQLGVDVAVDGVRDDDEQRTIAAAGCRLAQGPLFCAPSVPERVEAYLDTQRTTMH
ncbi:EAL domain-containing protein [Dactylosporangium sp. NPDC048998]|uniref:EAL domain-containing protein n=1 Tax=Dactylosporangium sp. NPDC048998 TaxID=3363976 RepID=UPI00371FDA27